MVAGGALWFGASQVGADAPTSTSSPTSAPETSAPPPTSDGTTTTTSTTTTTTSTSTSTTTTSSTSTTTTTSTTVPPLIVGEITPSAVTPERGTQVQVAPTQPPPPTTTTVPAYLRLPDNSGAGRRVVYSKSRMRVWTVEADGTVSKTHRVSGNLHPEKPRLGTFSVFSRSGYTCNINNPHICWRYMVRFTRGPSGDNIGFHEIPTNLETGYKLQSESQLGLALSGGCVRQATSDAIYIWNWAPIGTPVVVVW